MNNNDKFKIRIKIPSGAEFEAEGPESFIIAEKEKFLNFFINPLYSKKINQDEENFKHSSNTEVLKKDMINYSVSKKDEETETNTYGSFPVTVQKGETGDNGHYNHVNENDWQKITKTGKDGRLILISRPITMLPADAIIILLAAEQQLQNIKGITALALSRMLKSSGFQPPRLDRVLTNYISLGYIRHEGTKRNRIYMLTEEGFQKAALLAHSMAQEISK